MTLLEFEQALDRWGADLSRWPTDQAALALALIQSDPSARRSFDAAAEVEAYLHRLGAATDTAPGHLAGRIVARAPRRDGIERALDWLTGRLWRPALLAMVMTTGGYLAGAAMVEPVDAELADAVMSLAFNDLYAEVSDDR